MSLLAVSLNAQNLKQNPCKNTLDTILFIKNNKFGFYDLKNKKVLVKPKFDEATLFQPDYALTFSDNPVAKKYSAGIYATVGYKGHKYRMDKKGKLIYKIPLMQEPPPTVNVETDYIITRAGNHLYGIKFMGRQLVENIYDDISKLFYLDKNNSYFIVKKNNKYGVIDGKGKIIADIIYDEIDNPKKWDLQENGTVLIVIKNNIKDIIPLCNYH